MARLRRFDDLYAMAVALKGGPEALEELFPRLRTPEQLVRMPDHRFLARFSRGIFGTGLNWRVIENKWDGIEQAFWEFDIGRCAFMSDEDFDALLKDKRVIRHAAKILSVRDNAIFLGDLAREHGSAAKFFADWPVTDQIGLMKVLKKRGKRLGGNTGIYALRWLGKDSFLLTRDVVRALIREGVVDKPPTSQSALADVQAAFNEWAEESGRPVAEISRTLACTVE